MDPLKIGVGEAMPIISHPWTRKVWCCDQPWSVKLSTTTNPRRAI